MKAKLLIAAAAVFMTSHAGWAADAEEAPSRKAPRVLTAPEKGPNASARPFVANLGELASKNRDYRHVIFTGRLSQIALMSIPPGEDIGYETHGRVEQVLFIQGGQGRLAINGEIHELAPGDVVVVTPGVGHDIVNTGNEPLQIYTIYTPPNHIPGRVQPTKGAAEADRADEEFGRRVNEGQ